jgi:Zn-dependent membrane protease YugP
MFEKFFSFFDLSKPKETEPKNKQEVKQPNLNTANSTYNSYLVNDPTTPTITESVKVPTIGVLRYNVRNISFSPKNSIQKQALNCYVTIGNSINYAQSKSASMIKKWAATSMLDVVPQAGKDLNAYYDRSGLKFFYYPNGTKRMCTADSSDVVAHELGHAILDALRPDFWNIQSVEIWAFHEAFGDINAIASAMQYDSMLKTILAQTNNNITVSNSLSRLAEEFGVLICNIDRSSGNLADCLRNPAVECFLYANPSTLPSDGPSNQLCSEPHSFARVFTYAWYKLLCEIYKKELVVLKSPLAALKSARDICYTSIIQAIPNSPAVVGYYASIANSMINVAKIKYPNYAQTFTQVFVDCNIIKSGTIKILSNVSYKDIVADLKKEDQVVKNSKYSTVRLVNTKTIKLNNISILSNDKLNDVEVEVPSDKFYQFDQNGILVDEIKDSDDEILESTMLCVQNVEKHLDKIWSIKEGKLVRNYIKCCK